jgi:ATP-dependent 26S proteasome regulatory subunit
MDRIIQFPLPSVELRRAYLGMLAGDFLEATVVHTAAESTDGFSFAQLREAYILAGQLAFSRQAEIQPSDLAESILLIRDTFHDSNRYATKKGHTKPSVSANNGF